MAKTAAVIQKSQLGMLRFLPRRCYPVRMSESSMVR
jgi:hypothetical protein